MQASSQYTSIKALHQRLVISAAKDYKEMWTMTLSSKLYIPEKTKRGKVEHKIFRPICLHENKETSELTTLCLSKYF